MKQEEGVVLEVKDGLARIRVGRHSDCISCGACAGAQNVVVDAVNRLGAEPGQRVRFELQEEQVLTGAFVVFVLPLLAAGIGGILGWQFGLVQGMDTINHESLANPAISGALLFFLLSLFGVKLYDSKAARNRQTKPVIVEILS